MVGPISQDGAQAAARASQRWAARGLRSDLEAFLPYVEQRAARLVEPLRTHLHVDDLYLAFAC